MVRSSASKRPKKKSAQSFDFDSALSRVTQEPESNFAQILFAAENLFALNGFKGVGIRDIANAVNTNVSTVHFHWRNKAILYEAVCRYQAILIAEVLAIRATHQKPTADDLKERLRSLITLFAKNPSIAPIALQGVSRQALPDLPDLQRHDAILFEGLSSLLKHVSDKNSLGHSLSHLTFLNLFYSLVLLFNDSSTQQSLLGGSVFENRKLQNKITDFAGHLFDLISRDMLIKASDKRANLKE